MPSFKQKINLRVSELLTEGLREHYLVEQLKADFPRIRTRRLWREFKGLTGDQLANKCTKISNKTVTAKTVSHWENFPRNADYMTLDLSALSLLAKALGTSIHRLVDSEDLSALPVEQREHILGLDPPMQLISTPETRVRTNTKAGFLDFASLAATRSFQHSENVFVREPDVVDTNDLLSKARRLARDHLHINSLELFRETFVLREEIYDKLKRTSGHQDRNDLFLLASLLSCLLADTCASAGTYAQAEVIAKAAYKYAEIAGHDELKLWSKAKLWAIIARHMGNPNESIKLALSCEENTSTPMMRVQFHNALASYNAYAGKFDQAQYHIDMARYAREDHRDPEFLSDEIGGMFSYPIEKEFEVQSGTLLKLGAYSDAEKIGLQAVDIYSSNPLNRKAFGNESLARINIASARIKGFNNIDGADEILAPVFQLPSWKRQSWFVNSLTDVGGELEKPNYVGTLSKRLTERIENFASETSSDHTSVLEMNS